MTAMFRLPAAEFDALASGHGGIPAVRRLRSAQLSKHLLLTSHLVRSLGAGDDGVRRAWEVLAAARRRAPEPVNDLLRRPWTGAWAAANVRASAGLGYLGGLAAVSALRAGLDAELDLVVRDGRVVLPTVGVAQVYPHSGDVARVVVSGRIAVIQHGGGRVAVPAEPVEDGEGWRGMRWLDLVCERQRLRICLDDLDPYRDCYRMTVVPRMPLAELAPWRELFAEAWTLLVHHLPRRAEELSAGLFAAVPLTEGEGDPGLSATSHDAFGAFALNRPRSAAALVATLVHEFQHSKLNAVLDLVPLYDRSDGPLYHAPWRSDPRPLGALLQGAYAFLGVTDVWRVMAAAGVDIGPNDAWSIYAETREQMAYVLPQLAGSDRLTPAGRQFVAKMRDALAAMPVDG